MPKRTPRSTCLRTMSQTKGNILREEYDTIQRYSFSAIIYMYCPRHSIVAATHHLHSVGFEKGIMRDIDADQFVVGIARDLVTQVAPQELSIFQDTCDAYFANPAKMLKGQDGQEEPLGFDIVSSASTILITPIALAIVDEVTRIIVDKVAKSGTFSKLLQKLHLTRRANKKVTLPLRLTPEQMKQVRKVAVEKAGQCNLPKAQAELLADSLVGKLAMMNS